MKQTTKILNLKLDDTDSYSSVTPIYQCSAFSAESNFFYSRKDNPNVQEFEAVIKTLEEADYAIAVATGMSALYAVLDLLSPSDLLVINKHIYGCSYKLFDRVCRKRQIKIKVLDLSDDNELEMISNNVSMVLFETPTNPFLKTINIEKVSKFVKSKNNNALIVVDNTWATSLYQHPLKLGADISIHSCTKYVSGHSDVMGGIILVNDKGLNNELKNIRFYGGLILTPYHAWLLRRSMQTFSLRLKYQSEITKEMCGFLKNFDQINSIYYPEIDGEQLSDYGGIIFVQLREDLVDKYKLFAKTLKLFGTGTGMACVTSMVAQPYSGSHASMTDQEKDDMGLDKGLVRLCFGLEDIEDLKKDLQNAFETIDSLSACKKSC